MIKLKKGIRIEVLEKYGFEKRYDTKTGKITHYTHKDINRNIDVKKRIFEPSKSNNNNDYALRVALGFTGTTRYLPRINYNNYYSAKEVDLLFDLIKDDIVEKVDEAHKWTLAQWE